ncbi:hypothetical protein ABPG72_016315 [Tetrahymena utriculariae]
MKSNNVEFLKSQTSAFHSVSPTQKDIYSGRKINSQLNSQVIDSRNSDNVKRFPQVIECQETKKNQQKLHWRSHQFNTSEDEIVMIGHQQSLQQLHINQCTDIKQSLSPKTSHNQIKGSSLQQQQEKLKKIVNLQNMQASQKLLNAQTNTSLTNKQNNNSLNNQNGVQVNQMSKSNSSSILPPTKINLLTQPAKLNRSSHLKANNMLHLSNSIDYDCSSSYINPFNYISIKGGPQSTASQKKGQNQSTNNISNQQITKIHNSSQSNQRKTPQNVNNPNNSMNQPISSQILTSTSQNSNNSKVPNFFASPKVKKRQSATAAVSNTSQAVSMQASANKTNISKRAPQPQSQKNNTDTYQKINSQMLGDNSDEKASSLHSPLAQQLHSQLNQHLTISQCNESNNNQLNNLLANSPNSTYHQYQVISQKSKKSIQNNSCNGATQGLAKKKKKKVEASKNNYMIQSPQSTSYSALNINSSIKNHKQTGKNFNNNSISNQSKLHNASQITLDEEQSKKDYHVTHLLQSYQEKSDLNENGVEHGLQQAAQDNNHQQTNGRDQENTVSSPGQKIRISNSQENQKTLINNQSENHQEEQGNNYESSKQISRQSEKIHNEHENEENKVKRDSKKKKKSTRKSPSNREQNQKSKSPSQSRSQKRKQRSSQKRKYLKTSQSPNRSQNKSYSTHLQLSTDNYHQISKSFKQNQKLNSIKSSDNLENHSQNQNYCSSKELSKTQQNSLDKTKTQQHSIESSVRVKNQSEKLYNAQELINQNLQKQKLQKMIQLQKQKQEQVELQRKSQYLQEINEKYRQLNQQKSPKRDQNNQPFSSQQNSSTAHQINHINSFSPTHVEHKLPWGANQQKLNGHQNQQKMHKNQKSENEEPISPTTLQIIQTQKKEYQEKQRRERLGLGFLNDKNDSFVEQIVQKSKEKTKQINGQTSQFEQDMKTKKKHLLDAQKLQEIHKYMVYKKSIYEQNNMMKNQEKISKITKIKENKCILESNIKNILKRLKQSSSKSIKSKAAYPALKINPHYLSQLTETNGTQGPINYHFTSSESFCQNNLTSQNACNIESIPIESIDNTEENNYSYLQEEYKKMMSESLQKAFFFNKYNQLENPNSTNNHAIKTKSFTKMNQKMKSQIQSNKKDKKSGLQDTIKENQSDNDFNDLRGRDRAQVMKQKFNNLSNRFKKIFDNQNTTFNHEQSNLHMQSLSPQVQQDENQIKGQPKKAIQKSGSQSIQSRNTFKINDDNHVNTNGVNTTSTTTQIPNQLVQKISENHNTVPVFSANEQIQMKQDNDIEEIYQDDFAENGDFTDQDYYFIAVQYLNQSATQIQKIWRGYKARKLFHQLALNSNWLQKQEKIELNDFYNNNKDEDYGDNQDKVINISTIKSSIVSVNDQNDDQYKNSFPDVLANAVSANKQIPSIVKEEDSSQSRSLNTNCDINYNNYNSNNANNNSIQDQEFLQRSSKNSYHQASHQQQNQNTLDSKQNKQQNYDITQSQQDLQGLKDLVIQKFAQFQSQLQNAQNVNMDKEQSMKFLSQLQQITEEYKNELMSSFQNKLFSSQYEDQSLVQSGNKIYQNEKKDADNQIQNSLQSQFNNPQNEEGKINSNEEIDDVLIKNNEDQYEDKSLDGNEGNQESTNRQYNYHQHKTDYTENELLIKLLQDHAMKQELNQLYLLLIQEASKDKEKKYYPSSQALGASNQNSYRNSQRVKTNPDETDKDQKLQLSVDSIGQESVSSSLFDRDSFKLFTEKKLKELQKNEFIEEIIRLREQIINIRHKTEVEYMNKMLKEKAVSPRTYTTNKLELDNWAKKEQDELKETKNDFEKSLKRAIDSISKTKLDYELTKKYKENLHQNEIQGNNSSPFLIQKQFLVDNNQNDNQNDYYVGKNMKNLLPVSLQINESNTEENPLNSINSGFDNVNFHKFKEDLKDTALRELNNSSYYSSSDAQNNKSPLESLSNRKYQNNKKTGQENDDADDLVRVEEKSLSQQGAFSDRNGSFDGKKIMFQESGNQDDKQEKIISSSSISNQNNNNNNNNSEDPVILVTTTSKQNLQSSCESFTSQYDQKNPKMKDQLWDSSHLNHSHESQEYQQKNRERFTNEKMILKKEDHHVQHHHQLGFVKKSPRFDTSSFSDSKDTIKDLSPKSDQTEQNLFIEDESLYQKKIQPIFAQNQIQNTNLLSNNTSANINKSSSIQSENQLSNQQLIPSNQPDKKDANTNFNAQIVVNEVFNSINEEIKEKWRMNAQVEERLNEQLNRYGCVDKSDRYGIPSNLFVIEQYIMSLFQYVKNYYQQEFIDNINTPFGFSPQKRLKLIHGYDSFIEATSEQQLEEFSTLPFVLSEELFIEFEQNIIGNGEEEKDQIIKEFQHIHNKAIFDTFNESLNLFRPYFALGGSPYAWSKSEKNIIFCFATQQNIDSILEKAKKKVIEWASFLCGIINEHENINKRALRSEEDSETDDKLKSSQESDKSPLQSLLENNNQPENEYFAQSREERLSRMLLVEIFENEYKWQLYEDEKAEVLMELSDLVFEELVEEVVDEIADQFN